MLELSRCHLCAAVVPDTPEDRKDHIRSHKHVDKRLDAMTRSLHYLNAELEKAHAALAELQNATPATTELAGGLTINEFPDDETDDPDPTVEDDADLAPTFDAVTTDLAPTFDAVTTDLADLHDITTAPTPTVVVP